MERNPFLARRLARVVGEDTSGLSLKVSAAQAEALRAISSTPGGMHGGCLTLIPTFPLPVPLTLPLTLPLALTLTLTLALLASRCRSTTSRHS